MTCSIYQTLGNPTQTYSSAKKKRLFIVNSVNTSQGAPLGLLLASQLRSCDKVMTRATDLTHCFRVVTTPPPPTPLYHIKIYLHFSAQLKMDDIIKTNYYLQLRRKTHLKRKVIIFLKLLTTFEPFSSIASSSWDRSLFTPRVNKVPAWWLLSRVSATLKPINMLQRE